MDYIEILNEAIFAVIRPNTAQALADILNCEIKDLPDVLQHWTKVNKYYGNSILDNIDPMEWCVKDPWSEKINFSIVVSLSKRAFKKRRKELGLKPIDWEEIKDYQNTY